MHGSLRLSSVFISQSGEWRLGGFEVLSSMKEDDAIIYVGFLFFLPFPTMTDPNRHTVAWSRTLEDILLLRP